MKKSLNALLVIILSLMGASALAAKVDFNVHRVTIETSDSTGNTNDGNRTCGSKIEK